MSERFIESVVEDAALAWFGELGFAVLHGPEIAPGELAAERTSFGEGLLPKRLRAALRKLNPTLPTEALDEALRKVTVPQHPSLTRPTSRKRRRKRSCSRRNCSARSGRNERA